MSKRFFILLALGALSLTCFAVTPLWLRDVKISPDGSQILFCYKGDIYKVAAGGGTAQQLTTRESYEYSPAWSPDGRQIAFASDRQGNFDVFVMPAAGGPARQLTFNSSGETPWAFSPDGKYVYFSASIQDPAQSALFPRANMSELYRVPAQGGKTTQVLGTPAEAVCFTPDGQTLLYQDLKGLEDRWRKHHTSSVTRDIWRYDAKTGRHTNLTARAGEDREPVLSRDGKTVYFLSERDKKSFNVYSFALDNPKKVKQLTSHTTHPVRSLSIAADGTICYIYDGDIYTQRSNGKSQKVKIELIRDDAAKPADLTLTRGLTSESVSPDGKQVAFTVRGEVFVTSMEYSTTKQITHTAANEDDVVFGHDNRSLVYVSERDGHWNLYEARIAREEDPNFSNATLIEEKALFDGKDGIERTLPRFSPDGKELAFIEGRKALKVLNLASKKVRTVTDGSLWYSTSGAFDYEWSPDGQWFTLEIIGNRREPYADIALVSAQGGKVTNITESAYIDGYPRWVMGGNAILFLSNRYGMRSHGSWGSQDDVLMAFVNQDSYDRYRLSKEDYELLKDLEKEQKKNAAKSSDKDKKDGDKKDEAKDDVKAVKVETEGIGDRIVRLTPNSSDLAAAILDKEGDNLFYLSAFESGYDLWKMDLRKKEPKLLNKGAGQARMELSADGKTLYLLGANSMQKMETASGKLTPITFTAQMKMDLAAERQYMFDHVYQQVKQRHFDPKFFGVDWDKMTAAYRRFLPHIDNNYDFQMLLSEWLGELNVSHSGGRYYPELKTDATASLGLLFDWSYTGQGLKIDEVVKDGPFDHASSKVKAGAIVEKIDGTQLDDQTDITQLLNGKARKKTLVSLRGEGGERWDEVVLPITQSALNTLLYQRWVKQRAADVERLSGGRLGYVHLQSMNDGSYRTIYSDILGKFNMKEGIVIDTRFNGGGRLHEDIEVLFSGEKYLEQVIRDLVSCEMPSRRWNRPSIMITCEANYSNAHGTPWVYSRMKIGKTVGAPVPGTMSSVSWETLQDPTLVFGVPIVGYRTAEGNYLENTQLEPDILVLNKPEDIVRGEDAQLRAAVEELLREIDRK
ncbi:MAG: PD40 domain-containing protein [Bacteroidales bacterium]|nr:PD40 domain-containing protein [Bacteroidales bacterium]